MKKFILRVAIFLSPVLLAFAVTESLFTTDKGDLLKVGYIADIIPYDRAEIFKDEFNREKFFTHFSELDFSKKQKFKTLVIGDSFSEQGNFGFTNYLAESTANPLIYLDRNLHDNPIQTLVGIINGDLLDSIKIDYIVLQSVERTLATRTEIDESAILSIDSLNKVKEALKSAVPIGSNEVDKLFSDRMLKFTTINLGYPFDDNAFYSETYIVKTKDTLFSVDNNNLLFFFDDLRSIEENSKPKIVETLNTQLNSISAKLAEKGIKLIVLISPDKYSIYYDEIIGKEKYPKPEFFEMFNSLPKNYQFVKSEEILKKAIKDQKDLYFYDDTHWSPFAAKIITKEIETLIKEPN